MKRLLAVLSVLFIVTIPGGPMYAAEQTSPTSTQYEAFAARKGILLVRDFFEIGSVSGSYGASASVVALALSTPEGIKTFAVRLEIPPKAKGDETQIGVLDCDELDSVMQSLDYMVSLSRQMQDEVWEYREVDFTTKAGIQIGFYQSGKVQNGYLYVNRYASNGHMFFPTSQLSELWTLLQKAAEKLRRLGA